MFRPTLVAALFAVSALASAQAPNYTELKAKNPVQLSAEDLQKLIPGASVVSRTNTGSTRRWTNKADGTLTASSDNRGVASGRGRPSAGDGTWTLDGKGRWCVKIKWNVSQEDWCRHIFKVGDAYYGYGKLEDDALGSEFELTHS